MTTQEFFAGAARLGDSTVKTLHRGKEFKVSATDRSIVYYPASAKPRHQSAQSVERLLSEHKANGSWVPGMYSEKRIAAYFLALLKHLSA